MRRYSCFILVHWTIWFRISCAQNNKLAAIEANDVCNVWTYTVMNLPLISFYWENCRSAIGDVDIRVTGLLEYLDIITLLDQVS